jgi:hypothetical protein
MTDRHMSFMLDRHRGKGLLELDLNAGRIESMIWAVARRGMWLRSLLVQIEVNFASKR